MSTHVRKICSYFIYIVYFQEFYSPMQTTGLLTAEQLETVFINLDDLITINTQLTEKLRSALHNAAIACDQVSPLVQTTTCWGRLLLLDTTRLVRLCRPPLAGLVCYC